MMKALVHVNESHNWQMAVANIKNLAKAEQITEIALLLNGEAVELILEPANLDQILSELAVYVCNNSLKQRSIDPSSLDPILTVVPSGVVKLVEPQEEKFRYIKP